MWKAKKSSISSEYRENKHLRISTGCIYNHAHNTNLFIIKELQSLDLGPDYKNKDLYLKIQSTHYFSLAPLNPLLNPLSFHYIFHPFCKLDTTLTVSNNQFLFLINLTTNLLIPSSISTYANNSPFSLK